MAPGTSILSPVFDGTWDIYPLPSVSAELSFGGFEWWKTLLRPRRAVGLVAHG